MKRRKEFSPRASLAALGVKLRQSGMWDLITQRVQIQQKTVIYTPADKLLMAFINILAGSAGMVELNTRVRPDRALLRAFGLAACAEQSVVSQTLSAGTAENVSALRAALQEILRQHGQSYQHDYHRDWQVLDVDLTGLPGGKIGEGIVGGYFAGRKNRRGRQLGRVLATHYQELVAERLYPGRRQLNAALIELVTAAAAVLELDAARRRRTIIRIDSGGGCEDNVDWLLAQGYYILGKIHHWRRVYWLAQSVETWYPDPQIPGREFGWVTAPVAYVQPTRQLALRYPHTEAKDTYKYQAIVCNLPDRAICRLGRHPYRQDLTPEQRAVALVHAYDLRGGGVETQNRNDKQGLGLVKRRKQKFAAQQLLILLAQLAHNLIIWMRNQLAQYDDRFQHYGHLRLVRDVLQIPGCVYTSVTGKIVAIALELRHPWATTFQRACMPRLPT